MCILFIAEEISVDIKHGRGHGPKNVSTSYAPLSPKGGSPTLTSVLKKSNNLLKFRVRDARNKALLGLQQGGRKEGHYLIFADFPG